MGASCSAPDPVDRTFTDINVDTKGAAVASATVPPDLLARYQALIDEGTSIVADLQSFETASELVRDALRTKTPEADEAAYQGTLKTAFMVNRYLRFRKSLTASVPLLLDALNTATGAPFSSSAIDMSNNAGRLQSEAVQTPIRLLASLASIAVSIDLLFLKNPPTNDVSFFRRFCSKRRLSQDHDLYQLAYNPTITASVAVTAPTCLAIAESLHLATSGLSKRPDDYACPRGCDCDCHDTCTCGCDEVCPCHHAPVPAFFFALDKATKLSAAAVAERCGAVITLARYMTSYMDSHEGSCTPWNRAFLTLALICVNALLQTYQQSYLARAPEASLGVFDRESLVSIAASLKVTGAGNSELTLLKTALSCNARKLGGNVRDIEAVLQ